MENHGGTALAGIEEAIVNTSKEIFALLEQGSTKRRTAETLLNKQSSRSHSGGWRAGRAGVACLLQGRKGACLQWAPAMGA